MQGTVWMGLFMAPGLPLVNVIKLILIMYIKVTFTIIYITVTVMSLNRFKNLQRVHQCHCQNQPYHHHL